MDGSRRRKDGLNRDLLFNNLWFRLLFYDCVNLGKGDRLARRKSFNLGLRRGKGMVLDDADHDTWSAGSFFTNPIVGEAEVEGVRGRVAEKCGADVAESMPSYPGGKLSAAWLIERAGFPKGHPGEGAPARLSTKHTLALTNRGDATSADLIALAREIRDGVRDAFGVTLVPEPVWIGAELD